VSRAASAAQGSLSAAVLHACSGGAARSDAPSFELEEHLTADVAAVSRDRGIYRQRRFSSFPFSLYARRPLISVLAYLDASKI
jgi:hypothetical protein